MKTNKTKGKPDYDPLFLALVKLRGERVTTLAAATGYSRPYIMKLLIDPRAANGYDREKLAVALKVTTGFLDQIITRSIPGKITKQFEDLFQLQKNLEYEDRKKQTERKV